MLCIFPYQYLHMFTLVLLMFHFSQCMHCARIFVYINVHAHVFICIGVQNECRGAEEKMSPFKCRYAIFTRLHYRAL